MTTRLAYYREDLEDYCTSRKNFQKKIITINDQLKKLHRENLKAKKKILFLGGGTGAGKTTALQKDPLFSEYDCYNHVDPDSIKEFIPEYYGEDEFIRNADVVHDESSDIAKKMLETYRGYERCIVYDGTMKSMGKNIELIEAFHFAGYQVDVLFIDCDLRLAFLRAKTRAIKSGRIVDEEIIRDSNYLSAKTIYTILKAYSNIINEVSILYSGIDEGGKDCLNLMYNNENGGTIYNEELYKSFEQKALTPESNFISIKQMVANVKDMGGIINGNQ